METGKHTTGSGDKIQTVKEGIHNGLDPKLGGIPLARSVPGTDRKEFSVLDDQCEPANEVLNGFCSAIDRGYRFVPGTTLTSIAVAR